MIMKEQRSDAHTKLLVEKANKQMEKIAINLYQSGKAKNIEEATSMACQRFGKDMAAQLQWSLRKMGAEIHRITCP